MGIFSSIASAITPGVGAALGGLGSYLGQQSANQANSALSQKQMDFQERMSNTAYQRSVKDMRLAGINPILAAKSGGASTPGGSTANMANALGAGAASAAQLGLVTAQANKLKAETNLLTQKVPREEIINDFFTRVQNMIQGISPSGSSSAKTHAIGTLPGNQLTIKNRLIADITKMNSRGNKTSGSMTKFDKLKAILEQLF